MIRVKPEKKRYVAEIKTLDETHRKIASEFKRKQQALPKKKARLSKSKKDLADLESKGTTNYTTEDIRKRSKLKDTIQELETDINDIENSISEIDYYSKTDELLRDYYNLLDNEDKLFYQENPELSEAKKVPSVQSLDELDKLNSTLDKTKKQKRGIRRKNRVVVDESNSILKYMMQAASRPETETETEQETETQPESPKQDKAQILEQYMFLIDNNYAHDKRKGVNPIKTCADCAGDKTILQAEGICVCLNCGETEMMIIEAERPSYKENSTPEKPGLKWMSLKVHLLH
jgi:hypothetical protein